MPGLIRSSILPLELWWGTSGRGSQDSSQVPFLYGPAQLSPQELLCDWNYLGFKKIRERQTETDIHLTSGCPCNLQDSCLHLVDVGERLEVCLAATSSF